MKPVQICSHFLFTFSVHLLGRSETVAHNTQSSSTRSNRATISIPFSVILHTTYVAKSALPEFRISCVCIAASGLRIIT